MYDLCKRWIKHLVTTLRNIRMSLKKCYCAICCLFILYVLIFIRNYSHSGHMSDTLKQSVGNDTDMKHVTSSRTLRKPRMEEAYFKINRKEALLYGKIRRSAGFLTIGIPSVRRHNVTYLEDTLQSLISQTPPSDRSRVLLVVFLTDISHSWVVNRAKEIYQRFTEHVQSGFIQIVHPPHIAYPNFQLLQRRFNDDKERVAWRSKQNLDFSYLMTYSQPMSQYYLQLEDDVIATEHYIRKLEDFIKQNEKETWLFLRMSKLGFIGLLFRNSDLPKVSEFLLVLFDEKPCDLLINDLRVIKGQTKDLVLSPSLFQHMGLFSSLKKKVQALKDNTFQNKL